MSKYLLQASYTPEGVKGLLKDGGSGRKKAVTELMQSLEGKLEAFYFAYGDTDVFCIIDVPEPSMAAAAALAVSASGAVRCKTTVLITPEEMDKATKKTARYTPPGK
jgi:uncharacterized protein with GYD domain